MVKSFQVRYNEKIGNRFPEDPQRPWYTFSGWTRSGGAAVNENTSVTNDISISPNFNPINFNISYALDGGTWAAPGSSRRTTYNIELASDYSPPTPNPTKSGYDFIGWEPSEIKPTHVGDVTFVAKWELATYTITFDGNGGSPSTQTKSIKYTSPIGELPAVSRVGHKFLGWFNDSTGAQVTPTTLYNITTNITYKAHWQKNTYTLTFDANGGKFSDEKTTKEVTALYEDLVRTKLPTTNPTLTGYTFIGWFTQQIGGSKITGTSTETVTGHATYYAQWQANTYTIYFHPCVLPCDTFGESHGIKRGDVSVTSSAYHYDQQMTYGVAKHLITNEYTKNPVVSFNPWGQLPDWPDMNIIPTKQSSQWVIKRPTNYPTLLWSIQAVDYAPATFVGWATADSDGKKVYNENHYVSNLTTENNDVIHLYAIWKLGSVTLPGATNPGGWRFDGWYKGDKVTFIGFAGDELENVEAGTATYAKFTDIRITVTYFKNLGG